MKTVILIVLVLAVALLSGCSFGGNAEVHMFTVASDNVTMDADPSPQLQPHENRGGIVAALIIVSLISGCAAFVAGMSYNREKMIKALSGES